MVAVLASGAVADRLAVTGGTAVASTELTAFDAALFDAGIHDANLIRVSSITPAVASVDNDTDREAIVEEIVPGACYPAVYAASVADEPDTRVFAAVAGVELDAGYGINVECHGTNESEQTIRDRCRRMLCEMAEYREATLASDVWFHHESRLVPDGQASWAGAVAAIVYF